MRRVAICCLGLVACSYTKLDYNEDQIAAVGSLKELMDVQGTVGDPRFVLARKLDAKAMTENDFGQFIDMGQRLQATAKRLPEFNKEEGFGEYAQKLSSQAASLLGHAKAGDGPKTLKTARAIKKTCAACHSEYR